VSHQCPAKIFFRSQHTILKFGIQKFINKFNNHYHQKIKKNAYRAGVAEHTCNPTTETEAGRCEFKASLNFLETLSQGKKKNQEQH
jgi:hypothetical protein